MKPIVKSFTVQAAVNNAVCADQTKATAGALVIDGANASGGVATFPAAYAVSVTSDGNDSTRTYTITGTDSVGRAITETITGPNATTVYTTSVFLTVTAVSVGGGGTVGTVRVGFGSFGATAPLPMDYQGRPEFSLQVVVDTSGGTPTWTIQQTLDDVQTNAYPTWFDHPDSDLVTQTINRQGNYAFIPAAIRLKVASGTGKATLTVIQAGLQE